MSDGHIDQQGEKEKNTVGEQVSLGRPRYHIVAPRGWMNDPCAPGYVSSTGDFTLMYQWNPYSHLWDNISWGHMRSKDMVQWEQASNEPVFVPDQPYDKDGIFTGCLYPSSPSGDPNGLSIFYTSVPHIPIHWSQPHVRGQEGVALATSDDGGNTWTKSPLNPIVRAEPGHLDVTGFRDPSVIPWPTLDRLLGREAGTGLYALISGGVQDLSKDNSDSNGTSAKQDAEGPRLFLYDIEPSDLTQWRFLSTLGKTFPRNLTPHAWTGDLGTNWECATVFPLRHAASGIERDVCILGVEGGSLREHVEAYRGGNAGRPERAARYAHWFFTSLESAEIDHAAKGGENMEQIDMRYAQGSLVDWAELYAFATFPHPDGRRIALGWLVELDLSDELAAAKGWTGCLGLPRELELVVLDGVVGTLGGTAVEDLGSFDIKPDPKTAGAKRVITMGISPLRELVELRGEEIPLQATLTQDADMGVEMPECYELNLTASVPSADSSISLTLRATAADAAEPVETTIAFRGDDDSITIHRGNSSTHTGICLQDEIAPFTLLRFADGTIEDLDMHVFVDRDVIEVFVNGRVALSTRVYAPVEANRIKVNTEGGAEVRSLRSWKMRNIGLTR